MNDETFPDDTPSPELQAVNAVLDGSPTAAERDLVASTSELSNMVDQLRSDQSAIRAVAVPDAAREAGLVAALSVFDELHARAASVVVAPTNVVALDPRRRRMYRLLTSAAAALVVVVVGVAAIGALGRGQDDAASVADVAEDEAAKNADAPAEALTEMLPAPADAALPAADASTTFGESEPQRSDAPAPEESDTPAATTSVTIGEIPNGGATVTVRLADEQALAAYSADPVPLDPDFADTAKCFDDDAELLGEVIYQDTKAIVVRDAASGLVSAIDPLDCTVLASVRR